MTYRVPISDKLVGFRLRSLNRFVYKINKLIQINSSELHYNDERETWCAFTDDDAIDIDEWTLADDDIILLFEI